MRRSLIAGNWKMNKSASEAYAFLSALAPLLSGSEAEALVLPPFTALGEARRALEGSGVALGAQNFHWEENGAFTGEISASMLIEAGCTYVLVGHSERRQLFAETGMDCHKKMACAIRNGLKPILCVGEGMEERERGNALPFIATQLSEALEGIDLPQGACVAYEPIWAIGTGKTATEGQAHETAQFIREELRRKWPQSAEGTRILYGGSVKKSNIAAFMSLDEIDGALVGGASLDEGFAQIVQAARSQ
ncbi:MAG: triose-phosphate isomerase [Eubacteriaceae bacterium]|jgi:triosephosphate isomerase|nr:triose-phosphate isomerase [Eubacteriaceae bacterium]